MAVGTLVFDESSYRNVLCLGHILAEDGRKMSKHLGNILEPMPLMEKHGADALRWYMLAGGSPWAARRIGDDVLEDVVRKVLLTYWNTASFFVLYANASAWTPGAAPVAGRSPIDRCSTDGRSPNCTPPCSRSTRRSRTSTPRARAAGSRSSSTTCRTGTSGDRVAASGTATCRRSRPCTSASRSLTRLMAPFTPFITEEVHQRLVVDVWPDLPDSVHLRDWPKVDGALVDATLGRADVAGAPAGRARAVRAGRVEGAHPTAAGARARARAGLARAAAANCKTQVIDELNVREVVSDDGTRRRRWWSTTTIKPNFRALGKRFGNQTQAVAAAIAAADAATLAGRSRRRPIGVHRGRRKPPSNSSPTTWW